MELYFARSSLGLLSVAPSKQYPYYRGPMLHRAIVTF